MIYQIRMGNPGTNSKCLSAVANGNPVCRATAAIQMSF